MSNKKIRIAILGSRGIPARYGGFETITQELSTDLAKKGFDVYVSCEAKNFKKRPYAVYKGVKLVYFPIINSIRTISEVIYDALSAIWAAFKADVIYMLGYASIIALIVPKLLGKVVAVNVDGLEWKRRKFNRVVKFLLKCFEKLTVKIADYIIVDSYSIGSYYKKNYGISSIYIPNGIREVKPYSWEIIKKYGLERNGYYLVVARLEPENNIDLIIKGFKISNSNKKLVIISNLKRTKYCKKLLKLSRDKRILFLGAIYDRRLLMTLRRNCYAYIHGHEVGGTNPSLVEALSCGNAVLALNVAFNKEVAGRAALYFKKDPTDLKKRIEYLEKNVSKLNAMREMAYEIYKKRYTVKNMVETFESFIRLITSSKLSES